MLNTKTATIGKVSEMMYNAKQGVEAKYSHLLEGFTYALVSEMIFNAKKRGKLIPLSQVLVEEILR